MSSFTPWRRPALLAALATAVPLLALPAEGQKTDVVVLANEDRITGEVKQLERAQLRLKTDSMGTLEIEWPDISGLVSDKVFEIELESGEKIYGSLAPSGTPRQLRVVGEGVDRLVDHDTVVGLAHIQGSFVDRLDGSLDVGLSFTQASSTTTLVLNGELSSRTPKHLRRLQISSTLTDQEEVDRVARHAGTFTFTRFLGNRWQTQIFGRAESNEELDLRLRATAAGGAGRFLILTNRSQLLAVAGLSVNRENYRGAEEATENVEALTGIQYSLFLFGDQETDLTVTTLVWPSLSVSGRVRLETDLRFRRELVKDFYLSLNLYESYDSKPPTVEGAGNDWGFSTSIGYSF